MPARHGDISEYGYASYTTQNVRCYLEVVGHGAEPQVLALSSGFMTHAADVHPDYTRVRREIAARARALVLLPSLDYETCVAETVRRQLGLFCRSAHREEEVIRQRLWAYRSLLAARDDETGFRCPRAVANLQLIGLQPTAAGVGRISRPSPHAFLYSVQAAPDFARVALGAQRQIASLFSTDGKTVSHPEPRELWESPIAQPLPEDLMFIPQRPAGGAR